MEKQTTPYVLPPPAPAPARPRRTMSTKLVMALLGVLVLLAYFTPGQFAGAPASLAAQLKPKPPSGCEQVAPLLPPRDVHDVSTVWGAKARIIAWHQDSIRVPTEVWDEMGEPGEDGRWDIFARLHAVYEQSYPLVHKHLRRTKVDTWGLIYEWEGDEGDERKPLLITGHQDVVPVLKETEYQWEHGPFSGAYDGEYIWGRGSSDDKSTVTAVMAAVELLLEAGVKPARTLILAFGHDEERGGMRGAPAIRDWLLNKYGKGSMAMLIDEGSGLSSSWGRTFGMPAVAEKGKYDLNMTVSTLGGHSSVPPEHTGIGLAALLVARLEAHPHQPRLETESPVWGFLQCAAAHADMPKDIRKALGRATGAKGRRALADLLIERGIGESTTGPGQGNAVRALLSTTQAADMVRGGMKVNALPELVEVIVNHRLDVSGSIAELKARVFDTLAPLAAELDLVIEGYGRRQAPKGDARGTVHLGDCGFSEDLEPAPISPFEASAPAWRMLAGTSRGVWASRPGVGDGEVADLPDDEQLVMAPFMMTGNTDTRRYWDLTDNIYRWRYFTDQESQGIHTINERVSADAMVEFVRFFQALILNVDAARDL